MNSWPKKERKIRNAKNAPKPSETVSFIERYLKESGIAELVGEEVRLWAEHQERVHKIFMKYAGRKDDR